MGTLLAGAGTYFKAKYNSPKAQIRRLEKAGIHRNAFYAMGETGNLQGDPLSSAGAIASSLASMKSAQASAQQAQIAQDTFDELKNINANPKPQITGNYFADLVNSMKYLKLGGDETEGLNPRQFKALAEGRLDVSKSIASETEAQYTAGYKAPESTSRTKLNEQKLKESAQLTAKLKQDTLNAEERRNIIIKQAELLDLEIDYQDIENQMQLIDQEYQQLFKELELELKDASIDQIRTEIAKANKQIDLYTTQMFESLARTNNIDASTARLQTMLEQFKQDYAYQLTMQNWRDHGNFFQKGWASFSAGLNQFGRFIGLDRRNLPERTVERNPIGFK